MIKGLSEQDVITLQRALDHIRGMTHNPRNRPTFLENDHQAAEVYIAVAPAGGISACAESSGTGSGSSVAEVSSAECKIYDVRPFNSTSRVVPMRFTQRVYNLLPTAIAEGDIFLAVRDKGGTWVASVGSGGGSSSSGDTAVLQIQSGAAVGNAYPARVQQWNGSFSDLSTATVRVLNPAGTVSAGSTNFFAAGEFVPNAKYLGQSGGVDYYSSGSAFTPGVAYGLGGSDLNLNSSPNSWTNLWTLSNIPVGTYWVWGQITGEYSGSVTNFPTGDVGLSVSGRWTGESGGSFYPDGTNLEHIITPLIPSVPLTSFASRTVSLFGTAFPGVIWVVSSSTNSLSYEVYGLQSLSGTGAVNTHTIQGAYTAFSYVKVQP